MSLDCSHGEIQNVKVLDQKLGANGTAIAMKVRCNSREKIMSIDDGSNILDNALSLAIEDLENRGVSRGDAQIALLIRLQNVVPKDIAEIAEVLNKDPELLSVINKEAS